VQSESDEDDTQSALSVIVSLVPNALHRLTYLADDAHTYYRLSFLLGLCDLRIRTLYNQAGCSVPSIDHRVIVCQPCSIDVCHKEGKLFLFWLVEGGRTGTGSAAVASTVDKEGLVATSGAVSKERF